MCRGMKIQLSQNQIEITYRILECQFCQIRAREDKERLKMKKNSAIRNGCISVRGIIKLHPFGTSAEQSETIASK